MTTTQPVVGASFARRFFEVLGAARPLAEGLAIGRLLARLAADLGRSVAGRRFPLEEYIRQTWYVIGVCTVPALAVSIPFGVVLALQVGALAGEVGATAFTGAGNTLAVVRQASPIITALMLAGVAGSAICSDLGARKIREELDALEVMGIPVTERLVLPRMLAVVTVAVLLNGVVMFFAIMTTLVMTVAVQNLSAGSYLASVGTLTEMSDLYLSLVKAVVFGVICCVIAAHKGLSAKSGPAGVGDAVTNSVVLNFVALFAANFAISQLHVVLFGGSIL